MATPSREARKQRTNRAKALRLAQERKRRRIKVLATVIVVALVFGGIFTGLKLTEDDDPTAASDSPDTTAAPVETTLPAAPVAAGASIKGETPCPATDGSQARASSFEKAPPSCTDAAKAYSATFDTTQGKIVVALDMKTTPKAANNFVVLSRYKYYDGSAIVRTNTGIDIIQGGAPGTQTNGDPGPGYALDDEGLPTTYTEGDLVLANSGPNTSNAQFFFGAGPNVSQLDGQGTYIKFGHVTEGLDVLHAILALHKATDEANPAEGAPGTPVLVNSVTISES